MLVKALLIRIMKATKGSQELDCDMIRTPGWMTDKRVNKPPVAVSNRPLIKRELRCGKNSSKFSFFGVKVIDASELA